MNYKKPTPKDLRRANRAEIMRKIYFEGPISRLEISHQIGISPATVTNIVNALLEKNIIIESGVKRAENGRPSTMIMINQNYGHFIGIEVGETFVQVELFDIFFNSCQKTYAALPAKHIEPQQIVTTMLQGIEEVMQGNGLTEEDMIGIGIGFPGLVDPIKGVSVFTPNWGWHNVSITSLLSEHLSIPMLLDNGAKAMAMGEALFGAGQGINNLVVLLIGTGVGSGIITNRTLFRGSSNNAGEFGHTTLNADGPKCRCGSHGCMEVYLGANGIIDHYLTQQADPAMPCTEDQIACVKYILVEAEKNNPRAIHTIDETIRYLGISIANMINVLNPELLLLGGWLGMLLGSNFMERIEPIVSQYALQQSLVKTTIRVCQLAQDSVAKGAAAMLLNHFFETAGESESLLVGGRAISKTHKA
jgi:predicted NBD/HSP70 family sugar kinase